ncbi:MAG: pyruvate kinase [Flavobacteriales bacterium CG03_land_8_20_14_0_80_35_15]|nr:pyruvate kinase [Zetaproteobacteria bacterium]OIO09920.1 MAG: pyruvate kinase [Flavobacteriaceae bacterium CG1_02_35_72]PIV17465.1 MAG: pyruvate kinase [Flavobacteriales bacterium CG03_land_8_20_14_0_80_35_15]PIX06789.1 MAG: pyruvate kinase [Flavobacteriales bacterium CG_4_8_14_3_um_filter_35_10]PJA04941.1 MAG: pyruvate kinase [Flavobacteriales bacterium CG_4_10_14_0_2_um_filter_35_18]
MKHKGKKTKIVATLGPACSDREIMKDMMAAGVNVFRINFSHADYAVVEQNVKTIRSLNKELDYNVAVLADLQGPKLRVGVMQEGVELKVNDLFTFTTNNCEGTQEKAYMTYQHFPQDVKAGERILVDDGKLLFEVISTNGKDEVVTKVLRGGTLKSKKGVNLPNTNVSQPALTKKDVKDALFAISLEVDWIALSFVRTADDLDLLNKLIADNSTYKIPVIAKIEKPEALLNISKICSHCDGLMVARGDLGVEIPMEEVPLVQKSLVAQAKKARIPVIIATQMMETMIENQVPTRAEVNDVANSIMDGADAVMLSGETSVGKYPLEVIKKMRSIIEKVENSALIKMDTSSFNTVNERLITKTICQQACIMAENIDVAAINTLTNSGYTAFHISARRPHAHILAFTSNRRIMAMLNLLWGVKAFYYEKMMSTDATIIDINNIAKEKGYIDMGDYTISLTSMPIKEKGMVNTLRLTQID